MKSPRQRIAERRERIRRQPPLEVGRSTADRLFDLTGVILLALMLVYTYAAYPGLPDSIPTHFGPSGQPDAYGSRSTIWFFPAIAALLFIMVSLISRIPHRFNYPVTITQTNARRQYRLAIHLLNTLKVMLILVFFLIEWSVVRLAHTGADLPARLMLPFVLAVIFLPVSVYFFLAWKKG